MRAANNEAPAAATAEAPDQSHAQCERDSKYRAKRYATLQAAAALQGMQLHRLEGGRLLVTRWGLARELADVDEAARWLRTMGVRA